jgi:HSP20 family protein
MFKQERRQTMNQNLTYWKETWSPAVELRREFDRLFDSWTPTTRGLKTEPSFAPACDVEEADDHYLLTLEIAGVKKEDVKIEVMNNQIFISGERRLEVKTEQEGQRHTERRFGKFSRSFEFPTAMASDKVEATYQDGILSIFVPKVESAKPRQVQIKSGNGSSKILSKLLNNSKEKEEIAS